MKSCQKNENPDFSRTQMEKETIFRKLRACGGRITAQRKILLDIILEEECVCCKEIYYKAIKKDVKIFFAQKNSKNQGWIFEKKTPLYLE